MKGGVLRGLAMAFLIGQACVGENAAPVDARIGTNGHVRFTGGGCSASSSTTLAVGSTQELTLQTQGGAALPADLAADSTVPAIIDAHEGATRDRVELTAHEAGDATVELRSAGAVWDSLEFHAEPAASVKFQAADAVFSGGTYFVKVTDVYGSCGEGCPLLGQGFLDWSAEPAAGLGAATDVNAVASFLAGPAGDVRVEGREPTGGALLVDHALHVVPVADAGALDARITIMLPDQTVLDPQPLPVSMPEGSLFLIQAQADADGATVPLAGADTSWTVDGATGVASLLALDGPEPPEGPIYSADGPGTITMVADVPLLGATGRFDVTVTAGP